MIPDSIRPALARIVGAAAAAIAVAIMRYFGKELSPDVQSAFGDIGVFVAFAAYAAVHKVVSARTNPTDAASPTLAKVAAVPFGDDTRTRLASTLEQAAGSNAPNAVNGREG